MKILSMSATFGQLDHATLTLEPGLNIIEAPNEWGKSTWCAFIAAMLYGIDSRAHSATKTGLADKTRYEPWSGQLMSGRMDILWQGRAITLARSSTKRAAFRQFQAFETDTGLPVPELTAENCGQVLLGVEKEVFLRSAFIRLADLPVTANEALRRRLNALVTTGDESSAGDLLSDRLAKAKNEIRSNRSHGLLPQAEAQKQALTDKLEQLSQLRRQIKDLTAQQAQLEAAQQAQSATESARLRAFERLQQLQQSRLEKQAELKALDHAESSPLAAMEPGQVATDEKAYKKAAKQRKNGLSLALSLLPLPLGALGLLLHHWSGWALAGAGLLTAAIFFILQLRCRQKAAALCKALEDKYEGLPSKEWANRVLTMQAQQKARQEAGAELARLDSTIALLEQSLVSPAKADQQLSQQLGILQRQLGHCQGRMDSLGSEADLQAALQSCQARIRSLTDTLAAIELAQATLQQAKAQLQRRFAPRITGKAKALFSRMTGGRYDRLTLSEDLTLQAATTQEDTLRSSLWRSEGTIDQLYLALRLAVSGELMPQAPLVLDDALVRFDDQRLKKAMEVLSEEAESRQVILFTCQSREKQCI